LSLIKIEIGASAVAWYGAVTATVALGIEVVKLWLERRRVKLEILPKMHCIGEIFPDYPKDAHFVKFRVFNKGKRPVTITTLGVSLKKGNDLYIRPLYSPGFQIGSLPKEILDGQGHDFFTSFDELSENSDGFGKIDHFYVFDATGRKYKKRMDRKLLKKFRIKNVKESEKEKEPK